MGWVFAGAVVIESMYIQSVQKNFQLEQIDCDFFRVKKITKSQFSQYKNKEVVDINWHFAGTMKKQQAKCIIC
jgi:hypothetical protein